MKKDTARKEKQTGEWKMERLGNAIKKMVLVTLLLITSVLFANETNQSLLDGDLYKNRNYTEIKKMIEKNLFMENLIINGWRYVMIDDNGVGFGDYIRKGLFYKGGKFALISYSVDSKWNMKMLDAIYIPASQIPFRMVKSKKVYKEKKWSDVYSICGHGNKENERSMFDSSSYGKIIAIATPEIFDEDNLMDKIKKAWFVDEKSGQIKEIPADGVACLYVYGD